jgi:hypothetical protein
METRRSLVLALGALAVPALAAAQTQDGLDSVLRVTPSADGCVNEAALEPRVRRWLDGAAPREDVAVAVDAGAPKVAFSVLRAGAVIAERRFDVLPRDCGDRLDAIAVAIAVAIEHASSSASAGGEPGAPTSDAPARAPGQKDRGRGQASVAEAPPPAEAEAPEATTTDAPPANEPLAEPVEPELDPQQEAAPSSAEPELDPQREAAPSSATTSANRLFAGASLLLGVLPEAALALTAGGELQRSALRMSAAALITPVESETPLGEGRAHSRLLAARAHACLGTPLSGFDLEGCAGVAGGVVLAEGEGFPRDAEASMMWLAGVLRAAVRYPESSPISLRFALDGLLAARYPELQTRAPTEDSSAPGPAAAAASLELVIALP